MVDVNTRLCQAPEEEIRLISRQYEYCDDTCQHSSQRSRLCLGSAWDPHLGRNRGAAGLSLRSLALQLDLGKYNSPSHSNLISKSKPDKRDGTEKRLVIL